MMKKKTSKPRDGIGRADKNISWSTGIPKKRGYRISAKLKVHTFFSI
jgi:hypothetical protein